MVVHSGSPSFHFLSIFIRISLSFVHCLVRCLLPPAFSSSFITLLFTFILFTLLSFLSPLLCIFQLCLHFLLLCLTHFVLFSFNSPLWLRFFFPSLITLPFHAISLYLLLFIYISSLSVLCSLSISLLYISALFSLQLQLVSCLSLSSSLLF